MIPSSAIQAGALSPYAASAQNCRGAELVADVEVQEAVVAAEVRCYLKNNKPQMNADERRLRQNMLSAFICVHLRPFWFLIGHGTFDDHDYKFNLPGPDISVVNWVLLDARRA